MIMEPSQWQEQQLDDLVPHPPPSPLKDLAIVGNGLDQALRLPSRYADFRDFFQERSEAAFAQGDDALGDIFHQVKVVADAEWANFEEALADLDLPAGVAELGYPEQGDLSELDALVNDGTNYEGEFRRRLSDEFTAWIRDKVAPQAPAPAAPSICELVRGSDAFLTFNYTSTLTRLGVPTAKVLHIHGAAGGTTPPYFGCPAGAKVAARGGGVSGAARQNALEKLIEELTKVPRIELLNRFLSNTKRLSNVRVYGFSYGKADQGYIDTIVSRCSRETTWTHYCYTPRGEDAETTVDAERCNDSLALATFPGRIRFLPA